MLILSFKPGETCVLTCPDGQQVFVRVMHKANHGWTRLSFEGPDNIQIDREKIAYSKGLIKKPKK